jgi:hypothetical protein
MTSEAQDGGPGQPGRAARGKHGGEGGAGGKGGAGGEPEGVGGGGGKGGGGGEGAQGIQGERGPRGPVNRLAVIGYLILTLGIAIALYRVQAEVNQNKRALTALCAQRHDLDLRIERTQRDIDRTEQILSEFHDGQLIFGIPRQLIVDRLKDDKDDLTQSKVTRTNLEILDCP